MYLATPYRYAFVDNIKIQGIMKKIIIAFFLVLGSLDLIYGIIFRDNVSIIAGGAIVAITIYIVKKKT